MKISFDFDPTTKKVTNISVEEVESITPRKVVPSKQMAPTPSVIVQNGNSLKLNQDVLDKLNVKIGDRLIVQFKNNHPVLVTPQAANMEKGGNLITKSMTISVKGKTSEVLGPLGPIFDYELESEGCLVLSNESIVEMASAYESTAVETSEINPVLLDQTDFKSTILDGEEVEFSFEF